MGPKQKNLNGTPTDTISSNNTMEKIKLIKKFFCKNIFLFITLFGVIAGFILGFYLRSYKLTEESIMLISYPGELFMRVLKLIILPLIISSLIAGSASLNAKLNGKIALRTLVYFSLTSFFNACLGICLVLLIHPGDPGLHNMSNKAINSQSVNLMDSLLDLGRNIFPDNIFQAAFQQTHTVYVTSTNVKQNNTNETFVNTSSNNNQSDDNLYLIRSLQYRPGTNTLGIVFFCLIFGTLLGTLGNKGQIVVDFFSAVFDVVMKMVTGVMWLTPIGICSVIAGKILSVDDLALVMSQLIWFILTVAVGVFFYQLVIMQLIYFLFIRKNPFTFYIGLIQPMLTAAATASTAAALPITFQCMDEKLKIDKRIIRFVLPIGCNINMDGTALFIAIASIFIAQMNGKILEFGELITVCLTSTAASMSSASVPSAALVLLLVVLSAIQVPVKDVTLLFAIDWLVDRIRTTNNMLGDCYAAAVVEHLSKNELLALDETSVTQNGVVDNANVPEVIVVNNLNLSGDMTKF